MAPSRFAAIFPGLPSGLLTIYLFLRGGSVLMETRQKVSQAPRNEAQKTAQPPVFIVVSQNWVRARKDDDVMAHGMELRAALSSEQCTVFS